MFKNAVIAMLSAGCICLAELQKELVTPLLFFAMAFVIFSLILGIEMFCNRIKDMITSWINFRRTVKEITLNRPTKAC